ncbi:MAG: alpha/beta fold hydrolase [Halioglobus sp.]
MDTQQNQRIAFTLSADETQIAYALSGEGPPIVRAGTWLTHIQHDWESPIWSHWFRLMSHKHTLVRYDPRGCGLSQRETVDISLERWVDDLEAVVDKLGLDTFPLLGMSQGAAVAILYCLRHPERVSQLVLYAPLVTGWNGSQNPKALRWSAMENLVESGWGEENLAFASMFSQLFIPGATPEHIRWYANTQQKSTSKSSAKAIMKAMSEIRLFSRLEELNVPTLVVQVAGDQAISADSAKGIAAKIRDCQFVSIDSDNHILLEDEPGWDEFSQVFQRYFPGEDVSNSVEKVKKLDPAASKKLAQLSKRELEVVSKLALGLSNRDIGEQLFISEKTVRNHLSTIFSKLDVSSRSQVLLLTQGLNR